MTKKTIKQIELMLRNEMSRLENSFNEDLVRNSYTIRRISERLKKVEQQDIIQSISNILAECDFCYNKNRYLCTKNMPCSKCIYDFLINRIDSINSKKSLTLSVRLFFTIQQMRY